MPARSKVSDTLVIALEILKRIPRHGKISVNELHGQLRGIGLERTVRTVQRMLNMLVGAFDIELDDRDKPYGYRWKPRATGFAVPTLNAQESMVLALVQEQLKHLLPERVRQSLDPLFKQARTTLSATGAAGASREADWLRKVRLVSTSQPLLPPEVAKGVFEAVSEALYRNHYLDVSYVNAVGKRTESRVKPLGLAQQGTTLLLVCTFEGYGDLRHLALHRMTSAKVSDFDFKAPSDFDIRRYSAEGRFAWSDGQKISLVIRIDKREGLYVVESPLSADQRVLELDDQFEISATVVDSLHLRWWLMHFGSAVRILSPTSLAAEIKEEHRLAAQMVC